MIGSSTLPLLRFSLFADVSHGMSTRHGGVSAGPFTSLNMGYSTADSEANVRRNRRRFLEAVGATTAISARLTHGNQVTVLRASDSADLSLEKRPVRSGSDHEEQVFGTDGVLSDITGLHVLMTFADCVPILVADRRRGVIGAAHAGWRGTASGMASHLIRAMQDSFGCDPSDIIAGIGPSIGPCCYTVAEEVVAAFASRGSEPVLVRNGATRLDLWATNERQLQAAGASASAIENLRVCTGCNVDTYFSHRAEGGLTGRLALCIGKS